MRNYTPEQLQQNYDKFIEAIKKVFSGDGGEINTMIAPIYSMRGDTMIVTGKLWTPYDKVYYDTLKIILR